MLNAALNVSQVAYYRYPGTQQVSLHLSLLCKSDVLVLPMQLKSLCKKSDVSRIISCLPLRKWLGRAQICRLLEVSLLSIHMDFEEFFCFRSLTQIKQSKKRGFCFFVSLFIWFLVFFFFFPVLPACVLMQPGMGWSRPRGS